MARQFHYDHRALREREGILFGNAWLPENFSKSQVRLALKDWKDGTKHDHIPLAKVPHAEAERAGRMVEPLNYLGYGPIDRGKLKHGAALQAGETNILSLAWPESAAAEMPAALQLIDWFATLGGRSRNGWGSIALRPSTAKVGCEYPWQSAPLTSSHPLLKAVLRPLADCLASDWPHAIGQDERVLIWESKETFADWQQAMRFLATTKIGFRTSLKFSGGEPHRQVEPRHLLAYPVTHHKVQVWGHDARLANQIRFKVCPAEGGNRLTARIYHTPHRCPLPAGMSAVQELATWQTVHRWLDRQDNLKRLEA